MATIAELRAMQQHAPPRRGPPPPMDGYDSFGSGPRARMPPPPAMLAPPGPPPVEFCVDREKTCPLLLRVYTKPGGFHRLEEFAVRGKEPKGEIQMYTWFDATLRELSDLIQEVNAEARGRNCRMSFAFIYPDRNGRNVMRQVGTVHNSRPLSDDAQTLKSLRFQTGDYLDVAIYSY